MLSAIVTNTGKHQNVRIKTVLAKKKKKKKLSMALPRAVNDIHFEVRLCLGYDYG